MSLLVEISSCGFSVMGSRLVAAAHASFPPEGEEEKSEVEAERHRREGYQ
jgi:hypothetical protein